MHSKIVNFLSASSYHACLLLLHPDVCRLARLVDELTATYTWPRLSVGRELAAALLSEPPARRPQATRRWLEARLCEMVSAGDEIVLCTEIDLLFEPALHLDPLRLLRDASRVARIVVVWPGSYDGDVLAYAVPAHSHYRTWRRPDVLIKQLGS